MYWAVFSSKYLKIQENGGQETCASVNLMANLHGMPQDSNHPDTVYLDCKDSGCTDCPLCDCIVPNVISGISRYFYNTHNSRAGAKWIRR